MCRTAPCMGTPHDILKLIEAGYQDMIRERTFTTGQQFGVMPINMWQPIYDPDQHACVFLAGNRCKLHKSGLKPTEGKLADCKVYELKTGKMPPWLIVALTWDCKANREVIEEIGRLMTAYRQNKTVN